jgi:hypothetical protein
MKMLGIAPPAGDATLRQVSFYRKRTPSAQSATLEAWTGPINDVEILLRKVADDDIIKTAKMMPDSDFSLRADSKRGVAAYVGATTVEVDFEKRTITHHCQAWSTTSGAKKFCPHVTKVFLTIAPERARTALSDLNVHIDNWKFESEFSVKFPKNRKVSGDELEIFHRVGST